jgi:hypothetical protein
VSAYRRIGVGGKRIGVSANVRFAGLRTPLRCLVNTPTRRYADPPIRFSLTLPGNER